MSVAPKYQAREDEGAAMTSSTRYVAAPPPGTRIAWAAKAHIIKAWPGLLCGADVPAGVSAIVCDHTVPLCRRCEKEQA